MKQKQKTLIMPILGILAAVLLAACSTTQSTSNTAVKSNSKQLNSIVKADKAYVTQLLKRPSGPISVPLLPSKPRTGGTIDFIVCGLPVCDEELAITEKATNLIGWSIVPIQAGETPQTVTAAYDQAVRNHPTAVIGSGGFPPAEMAHQLQELTAMGIPSVLLFVPNRGDATTAIWVDANEYQLGEEMGKWIIANSNGHNAHIGVMYTPGAPEFADATKGIEKEVSLGCSGCNVNVYSFNYSDIGTTLPAEVVSYLIRHPSINYLYFGFTNEIAGVPAALQSAGLEKRVTIVTTDSNPPEAVYMLHGEIAASAGFPWGSALAEAVNEILRATMHLPVPAASNLSWPQMILTANNLPKSAINGLFPLDKDYLASFAKAWHVPYSNTAG